MTSPDTSYLLVAMIVWNLDSIIVDVEMAFLHRDLEEEVYMNLPNGMEGSDDECLLLLKALYGLVQGAHQWWKKFIGILKNIEFKGGRLCQSLSYDQAFKRWNSVCLHLHR